VDRGILENRGDVFQLSARSISGYDREHLKSQFLASLPIYQWVERDDAVRTFARWMGFRRTGPSIVECTRSLINGLLREDRLEREGTTIRRAGSRSEKAKITTNALAAS